MDWRGHSFRAFAYRPDFTRCGMYDAAHPEVPERIGGLEG
jgi:hypothetical protein